MQKPLLHPDILRCIAGILRLLQTSLREYSDL